MEELKGQLGERFPAAVSLMAEATGRTTAELLKAMEAGEVKSDVLLKFAELLSKKAREGDALALAMESTAAQQARFNNAFTKSVEAFSKAGFDKSMGGFFKAAADSLENAEPLVKALAQAFDMLLRPVNALIVIMGEIGRQWPSIAAAFGLTEGQLAALAVTAGLLLLPFGSLLLLVSGIALAIEDLTSYNKGMESVFGNWLKETPEAQVAFDDLKTTTSDLGTEMGKLFEGSEELVKSIKSITFSDVLLFTMRELNSLMGQILKVIEAINAFRSGKTEEGLGHMDSFAAEKSLWNTARGNNEALNKFDWNLTPAKDQGGWRQQMERDEAFRRYGPNPVGVLPLNQPPPGPVSTPPEKSSVQQAAPLGPVKIDINVMPGMDKPRDIATEVDKRLRETFQMWHTKEVK